MRDGKYGPYVNLAKVNATLPKGKDPMSVTLEEALVLIAEQAAKTRRRQEAAPQGWPTRREDQPPKTSAAKKPAAKKGGCEEKGIGPVGEKRLRRAQDKRHEPGLWAGAQPRTARATSGRAARKTFSATSQENPDTRGQARDRPAPSR